MTRVRIDGVAITRQGGHPAIQNTAITRTAVNRKLAVTSLVLGGALMFGDANFLFVILTSGRLLVRQIESLMQVLLVINPLSPHVLIGTVGRDQPRRCLAGFNFILWPLANAW